MNANNVVVDAFIAAIVVAVVVAVCVAVVVAASISGSFAASVSFSSSVTAYFSPSIAESTIKIPVQPQNIAISMLIKLLQCWFTQATVPAKSQLNEKYIYRIFWKISFTFLFSAVVYV